MNVASLLEHWSLTENPFRAEEARHDPVFARLEAGPMTHPDFEKILGDLSRPSTSIVFGEKGSGKTAIRLQIADRIEDYNAEHPDARVLLVPYDDLNPTLDHFCAQMDVADSGDHQKVFKALKKLRLVDHMDAILRAAVPLVIDEMLGESKASRNLWRAVRKAPASVKRDALLLQVLYDRPNHAERRAAQLRWRLGARLNRHRLLWGGLASAGWIVPAAVGIASFMLPTESVPPMLTLWLFWLTLGAWGFFALKWFGIDRWLIGRQAKKIMREMRAVPRSAETLSRILRRLPPEDRRRELLPSSESDDARYAMFERVRRITQALGYSGIIIVLDRIDEPTVISGDPDRMRAVVWPLMNNKFLQQERIGFKMLLPIELRHELFRENSSFFQEARLDKQNLVERLIWTGATLYDLCTARLMACRMPTAEGPMSLVDMFTSDVTRQDIVDALDQMHQPRDAFKLLYQCIQEHCSNVTEDQQSVQIPRLVLETVRKQQSDRVQMFYRGVRPA